MTILIIWCSNTVLSAEVAVAEISSGNLVCIVISGVTAGNIDFKPVLQPFCCGLFQIFLINPFSY